MHADDRTLLRRTHAGHEPSARELWRRHAGWMLAFARMVAGERRGVSAEDVVQAVFCRLLGLDRRSVRAVAEVRAYLAQCTRREALNQLRSARRAAQREGRRGALREARRGPDGSWAPESSELAAAMARLPRRLREVVHLHHIAGLSTEQTALALGLPRGTVASRTHAGVRTLRELLGVQDPPEAGRSSTLATGEACHALAE